MAIKKAKPTKNNGSMVRAVRKKVTEEGKVKKAKKVNSAKKKTGKKVKRA